MEARRTWSGLENPCAEGDWFGQPWRAGRPRPAGRARRPSLHRMTHHAVTVLVLLCTLPTRYTARYEYSEPTECEVRANPRLPRGLLQQRANPGECLGFLPRFRNDAAKLGDAGGTAELPGDLSQPATGESPHGALAAERGELRVCVRRDQT